MVDHPTRHRARLTGRQIAQLILGAGLFVFLMLQRPAIQSIWPRLFVDACAGFSLGVAARPLVRR